MRRWLGLRLFALAPRPSRTGRSPTPAPLLLADEVARLVTLLGKPAPLDRLQGDVHPAGNPHIQTDPHHIARVAQALAALQI